MSSHHIVRDQQEPALIIHLLSKFPVGTLHSLLEWSPTVVCVENSIEQYTTYGHKLDVAVVSFENIEFWKKELQNQQPVDVLGITDDHSLHKSLEILNERGHRAINIITEDQFVFSIIHELQKWLEQVDLVIYSETSRYVIQKTYLFQKWMPAGSQLFIRPIVEDSEFSTSGFNTNVKGEIITGPVALLKSEEGNVAIQCSHTPYLIAENM